MIIGRRIAYYVFSLKFEAVESHIAYNIAVMVSSLFKRPC